ncbi:MAG: hypothetical protein U0269_35050 [Polyangiales bacterium]
MSSAKGQILRWLGDFVLRESAVRAVTIREPFAEIELDAIDGAQPGDKIQILLPGNDVRTYTPIAGARTTLLVHLHADTPGPRWARSLREGDRVRFKGPDRCVRLPEGAVTLIGDATSIATALAFNAVARERVTCLIEGDAPFDGLRTFERGDYRAIAESVAPSSSVVLTGGAALVQGVRAELRKRSIEPKSKAYWAPGRVGLD